MIIFELSIIAALPVIISILLFTLFQDEILKTVSSKIKQIIAGILFGLLAIVGTELGVKVDGIVLNARDAAPLCAGLIFGPMAGILAGIIGGVERYVAVLWGAGTYTRLACSIATILSGLLAATFKKYMFDNKLPNWYYSFAVGIVAETMHMLMIFITHLNDITNAFAVVRLCTIPMVSVNAIAVALAVLVIDILDKKNLFEKKGKKITLSQQFQKGLLFVVIIAFVLTTSFNYVLQNRITNAEAEDILKLNINDVKGAIVDASNNNLLKATRKIQSEVSKEKNITNEYLLELANRYNVSEINIVDSRGYISDSTNLEFINFDMNSGEQSREFLAINDWTVSEIVQDYMPMTYDSSQGRKYAAIALAQGFVQVGYDAERFQTEIEDDVKEAASNRHVGEGGGIIIADSNNLIVSSNVEFEGLTLDSLGIDTKSLLSSTYKVLKTDVYDEEYYFMYLESEGYKIFSYIPASEIDFSKYISLYTTTFMEVVVYALLFIVVFFICKSHVVGNVRKVNKSLAKITNGDLDEVLEINNNEEFTSLSKGINTTVNSMKKLIADANARIDQELQYARDIQFSALPSVFPPFPNRDEFDIFALMRPAKSVGGDFYDFYFINENTLAFVVADVSGKGIPAALFMMRSKSILKSLAESGTAVNDVLTSTNNQLCEGNTTGMFVTAWMGFLNLETGELKFANAGHNPPVVRRKDGEFEYLKSKVGFILGGMEDIKYTEQSINLNEGDEIFLYTDGVVEATNKETVLYGDERLKSALDHYRYEDATAMCKSLLENVDAFVGEAPQFDDITMLSIKLKKLVKKG